MTRSQFILGAALLCVSGTLAFFISFRDQEKKQIIAPAASPTQSPQPSVRSQRSSPLLLSDRKIEKVDPTIYEVSVSDLSLRELGQRIEIDSRERLKKMTARYQLSPNQRREIFPLLVRHHAEYQEGLIVNGSTTSGPGDKKLASEIYPILDPSQQEDYQETLLADNEWWGEIIGQLREDLDQALDAGEVELITEPAEPLTRPTSERRNPERN